MLRLYLTYLWQEARSAICSPSFSLMGIKIYFTAGCIEIPIILLFLLRVVHELRLYRERFLRARYKIWVFHLHTWFTDSFQLSFSSVSFGTCSAPHYALRNKCIRHLQLEAIHGM